MLGIGSSHMSGLLQNDRSWKATPTLLDHALKIIDACGGEPRDLDNWTKYHYQVVRYQATGTLPLPAPPEPARLATTSEPAASDLFEPPAELDTIHLPSALLRADHGIVPFEHRREDLAHLAAWAENAERVSSLLITAPGGQGKTRIAMRLCEVLRARGWLAGFLAHNPPGSPFIDDKTRATLLVIDYAEGRTDQVVAAVRAMRGLERGRVLLLSRSAGLWQRDLLDTDDEMAAAVLAGTTEVSLPPMVVAGDRTAEFSRAVRAFAHRFEVPAAIVTVPDDLDDDRYETALDIHAAALAGVLDQGEPDDRGPAWRDPVLRVLHHERRYWARTIASYELVDAHRGRLDQVVAAGTLFGAPDRASALGLLEDLPTFGDVTPDVIERFVRWSADLYRGGGVLNGMRPDRLGEDHVAEVLRAEPDTVTGLATRMSDAQLTQGFTVLGRATARHRHLVDIAAALLRRCPGRAVPIGMRIATQLGDPAGVVAALATVVGELDDFALLNRLLDELPDVSIALAEIGARIAGRAVAVHPSLEEDPALAAHLLTMLGTYLLGIDDDRAVAVLGEVVTICQVLAEVDAEQFRPRLSGAVANLSIGLTNLGQHEGSLDRMADATDLLRHLVGTSPAFVPDLVNALLWMNRGHSRAEQFDEALSSVDEALEWNTRRQASDARSAARAEALASRCVIHATLGRFEEALADSTETITLLRDLAERHPDKYRHEYALALANGVGTLWKNGRVEDALHCADEAVRLGTELVSVRRTMFLPVLALAHTNRSAVFAQLGRHGDAVADLDVAVHAYRQLADRRPEVYLPDLAEKVGNRADQHLLAGSLHEALADAEESADLHRKLVDPDSADGSTELENALFRLYRIYRDMRKNRKAHDVIVQLVTFERDRVAVAPEEAVPLLAIALRHLASALAMLDRHAESLTAAAESVELLRPLADEDSDFLEELAEARLTHGSALAALDRHREAAHVLRDCLNNFATLDRAQPNEYSDRIDAARRLHDQLRDE